MTADNPFSRRTPAILSKMLRAPALTCSLALALAPGCGGYSSEDAKVYCDQEEQALAFCFDEKVYDECIHCYEECGVDCDRTASCPEQYVCRDD
jgi:hypothetical protein